MNALDIQRASIMGHSLGGAMALQFAHVYPLRVEHLARALPNAQLQIITDVGHIPNDKAKHIVNRASWEF